MAYLETIQQQLPIDRELGDRRAEAITLTNLGSIWLSLGERTQARRHLQEGLRLIRAVGDRAIEPYSLLHLSLLARRLGDDATALAHAQSALDIATAVQDRRVEAGALCSLGNAELALGRHASAVAAFERAHAVALAIDHVLRYDAAAGLAQVALAQGDVESALLSLEGVLAHLDSGGTLAGTEAPQLIHLTCYQVLVRTGDPRGAEVLATAHSELQDRSATITDATLRRSFLNNVPEHREIVAAWAAGQGSPQGQV